ncbi:c-type cytochrome [Pontivivens insulae]|uniref:Cytochrome c-556 n=1 Tax=Pontivivens insulae TaxID=1639689 RepID=A0A2R8AEU3_9RHOB|nr:cytochrome c [Pontivivens insulae]RED12017.1 cytochrome c556 [Pontivivens insulae]SPF30773.1 Cytochrome c-556 [Pontivivens insulae]
MRLIHYAMIAALAAAPVQAHSGATGIVKTRMDAMKEMREAMRGLGMMTRGMMPYDAELQARAVDILLTHAPEIEDWFPEESLGGDSEALPLIAVERDAFNAIAVEFENSSRALADATTLEEAQPLIQAVSDTCSSCHRRYQDD